MDDRLGFAFRCADTLDGWAAEEATLRDANPAVMDAWAAAYRDPEYNGSTCLRCGMAVGSITWGARATRFDQHNAWHRAWSIRLVMFQVTISTMASIMEKAGLAPDAE